MLEVARPCAHLRPTVVLDWLVESESHFLGQIIVIIWPKNKAYTIVRLLPFIHSDEIK